MTGRLRAAEWLLRWGSGGWRAAGVLMMGLCVGRAAAETHGQVKYAGMPVPGATVTLTRGAESLTTVTDDQGVYEFPTAEDGAWTIHIAMTGFAPLDGKVVVDAKAPQGDWELEVLSLEAMLAQTKVVTPGVAGLKPRPAEQAGSSAEKKDDVPQAPAAPPSEQAGERGDDGLLINGSESNAATSPFTLSPAFGNRRPGAKGLYTGGFGVRYDNSVLDARPYSLSGLEVPKDAYNRVTMLVTVGGPIRIPPLFYHGPNFYVGYQWTRNTDAATGSGLVPDAAERNGDLSGILDAQGQPVTVYNPATGLPFTGSVPLSTQARALLALYPLPNLAGNARYNYETSLLSEQHEDALQSRLDKTLGRRDSLYGGFGFESTRSNAGNLFGFVDTTNVLGLDANANWSHRYRHGVFVLLGYHLTRERTEVRPGFADRVNVSGNAGIAGNEQDGADWGPPSLNFASGIASLSDGNSEFNRNRTDNGSVKVSTTRGRHTVTFGGDLRRQEFNQFGQANPRGTFTFTGAATAGAGSSGSDLADFLTGVPDTSALAYGNADKYLRQTVTDAYATDDWRVRPELTLNAGMRWEYGAPITELKGRLVNLDVAQGFAAVAPVLGSAPTGSLTGAAYPAALVRPDRRGFEPRVGISWRPVPASTLVLRAGYGIYDDTSVYLGAAESMAQQAPLSTSVSVANSASCPLTLANGFRDCAGTTADTFGVDPNLRVGYAQVWSLSAQRDLPGALVLTASYLGTKGTRGMQEFLPNTVPVGATSPCPLCPVGFVYRTSNGNSEREAGTVQLRRRLRRGFTATVQYTYAKAVDDDAQVGAQGHVVSALASSGGSGAVGAAPMIAQNWLNLPGERGRSSFDQRHALTATMQYTSGMGLGGGTLMTGWRGRVLKEWTLLGQLTAGSGLPETPVYLAAVPGTGVTGTIRPDATGAPVHGGTGGAFLNAAAYNAPTSGQWGTAGRNSITGPGQFNLNGSLARTFRLRDPFNLDVRLDATNVLNNGVFTSYNTVVNGSTFGLPTGVNPMRSVQVTGRLRF